MSTEDFHSWLEGTFESGGTRYEHIAWLVKCNGGFQVHGWGSIGFGGCFQQGLDQEDAIELIQWESWFSGVAKFGGFDPFDLFMPYYEKYVESVEAKYQEHINSSEG